MADFGYSRFNVPKMIHLRATLLQRCIFQSSCFWTCATPTNPVGTLKWRRRSDASGSSGTGAEEWDVACVFQNQLASLGFNLGSHPARIGKIGISGLYRN